MKTLLALVLVSAATVTTAQAQGRGYYAAAPEPAAYSGYEHNRGVMIGLGIGASTLTCDGCESSSGLGLDFHLGGFITPRLAIMYDAQGWADSDNGDTLVVSTNTIAAQYYFTPKLWAKAGLGFSQARVSFAGLGTDSDTGVGVTAALGFEIVQSGNFAMDISGRAGFMDFEWGEIQNYSLLLGFNWK